MVDNKERASSFFPFSLKEKIDNSVPHNVKTALSKFMEIDDNTDEKFQETAVSSLQHYAQLFFGRTTLKRVTFAKKVKVFHYVSEKTSNPKENNGDDVVIKDDSGMTEEITVLSSLHGKARRHLRDITKYDLQSAIKYGVKTRAVRDRVTGDQRWKYAYRNVVYITDSTSKKEITSYKEAAKIHPCPVTKEMIERHNDVKKILKHEPQLCTTHTIVVIDQSASMKIADVYGFRNRSQAAYGTLALDYIAEQLYNRGDKRFVDAVTIIEMKNYGNMFLYREPLDWILFNKLLDRQVESKPRSHGNYINSLRVAETIISKEKRQLKDLDVDADDIPAYMLIFISDGKPSDKSLQEKEDRNRIIASLAKSLKQKFTVCAMGISAKGSDFSALESMVEIAKDYGGQGNFNHIGLSYDKLSSAFTSISTTMTTTRTEMIYDIKGCQKEEKDIVCVPLRERSDLVIQGKYEQYIHGVTRWYFDYQLYKKQRDNENKWPWRICDFAHNKSRGFEVDDIPFGKGAERLAHRFFEIDQHGDRLGKMMVAKESRFLHNYEEGKVEFHENFCRVQSKASLLAIEFNKSVKKTPMLKSHETESNRAPEIIFLECSVYEYNADGESRGVLVEDFLNGKFTKFNNNNGYVNKESQGRKICLEIGEVFMTDFLQAFSHWTYVHTQHELLVCDLQGILNEEGRYPKFELTDPVICSKKGKRFGDTDRRLKGVRNFCVSHRCNEVCRGLGLPSFGTMKDNFCDDKAQD